MLVCECSQRSQGWLHGYGIDGCFTFPPGFGRRAPGEGSLALVAGCGWRSALKIIWTLDTVELHPNCLETRTPPGSAVGSCWLKCGAAVGKAVHWIGTFIARTFASVGRCIHSIFASVNSGSRILETPDAVLPWPFE